MILPEYNPRMGFFVSHLSFLNPLGWWLALFAIPIVILHLRKVQLRRQPVPTLLFWEQVLAEHRVRSFGRRFRPSLSLFLSLLFLALLVGAVLDPVLTLPKIVKPQDDVVITRFQPRRLFADPLGYEVFVELVNYNDASKECLLELTLNEQLVDLKPLTLAANSTTAQILYGQSAQGGTLKATLDIAAGTASAPLPARERQKLRLHGTDDFFLTRVLRSQQNVELLSTEAGENVLVYHQAVPERIPEGNVLIVDPRNDCDLFTVGEPLESPLVGQASNDSPLMRFVCLNNGPVSGLREIRFSENAERPQILAATSEGNPIFFQWDQGEKGKVTVLSVDLKRSDLVFRTAFPIMVSNILDSFRADSGEQEQTVQTADVSEGDLHKPSAIWRFLTLAALFLILFDWLLYHRNRVYNLRNITW